MTQLAEAFRDELDRIYGPELINLADVRLERVSWLWPGRLPAGKLVLIDGDPSAGKSTLTTDMTARVTTGRRWPDGAPCPEGDVLIMSAEDGLADTIAPRLVAADADRRRVHALMRVPVTDDEGATRYELPSLPRDIPTIRKIATDKGVRLIIIDVMMAYLNGKVDSHRDQDVRGVLHQLADMAEQTGATVLLIRHMNKAAGTNVLYRGGGSIGIIGAARAAFLVARDPDDESRRILAVTKSNLTAEPPALAYRLVDDPDTGCARVEWESAPVDYSAAQLLRSPGDDERTEHDEAAEWLTAYLEERGGSDAAKDILKAARADGIAERTLKRARVRAGVDSERRGFGAGSVWTIRASLGPFGPTQNAGPNGTNGGPNDDQTAQQEELL